ncbi:16942_t:CDS:2 [Rhizophagus irregularis]|nr:16942_t:CDS:2 [Rhizophagus irregularis]
MSDIYERINKLGLEQEEIIKIKSYLVRSKEIREQLLLALASCKSEEEEKGVIWNLLHSDERQGLTVTATNENDNMTYKTLPSWQKTKYDRLADESLKALYLETIREEREKSELNLDIIKVALISLVNISMDVLNKSHNDDESIKIFMLILNAVVDGIQLLVIILKIVRIVVVVIVLFSILLKVDISPNIAIYWVDAGLSCSELLLKAHFGCIGNKNKLCPKCPSIDDLEKERYYISSTFDGASKKRKRKDNSRKSTSGTKAQTIICELSIRPAREKKNGDRTNRDLVRFCFRFGKALSERLAILLQSNPPQRKQRIQSLTINKEVKDKLPENANNGMVRKRTDTARKIFDIFSVIWEDKILRIKLSNVVSHMWYCEA